MAARVRKRTLLRSAGRRRDVPLCDACDSY